MKLSTRLLRSVILTLGCAKTLVAQQLTLPEQALALDDSLEIAVLSIHHAPILDAKQVVVYQNKQYTLDVALEAPTQNVHTLTTRTGKTYSLYLTELPLIQITSKQEIINEPKRMTRLSYIDADTLVTAYAGVELRGSSSLVFPKKTYDLNFYTDNTASHNLDLSLAGMRKDDDWILDAIHNEPLRMRSYLSYGLWNQIHQPYYLKKEPKAKAGARVAYAEVFLNNRYKGLYLLSEQVDRKLLRIKKEKPNRIRGELFQGARYLGGVTFDSLPQKKNYLPFWGGYDIKYPVPNNTPWDNIYRFTDFVISSDDSAFASAISDQFELDNAIDYFLFINALRAPDNLGKNLYVARYDQKSPYFYVPWDLDGSFGTIFSGKRIATTDDFLTNGLLRRLLAVNPEAFVARLQARWTELRQSVLSEAVLLKKQEDTYTYLLSHKIYEREQKAWPEVMYEKEGLDYMQGWTRDRLSFLDSYIARLATQEPQAKE